MTTATIPNAVMSLEKAWYSHDELNPTVCVELTPLAAQWLENLGASFPSIGMGAGTEGMVNSQLPIRESDSQKYFGSDLVGDVIADLTDEVKEIIYDFIDEVLVLAVNRLEA